MWLVFAATLATLLIVDLAVLMRRPHQPAVREAARWCGIVIIAAAAFGVTIWWRLGPASAAQFGTGYVVELALSVDNLMVFILVLRYFAVPVALQAVVLKWGIVGAIVMRGVMIGGGTILLNRLAWVIYLLAALLIVTGIRMLRPEAVDDIDPGRSPVLRAARRILPVTDGFRGTAFVVREQGRLLVTPLLLVVLVVEWTDLVFAADSIPAIFAITRDPFLVYTSNIFAIVGLRALFFLLAGMIARFGYLRYGVALVLVLVGVKMLLAHWITLSPLVVLLGVVAVLGMSVVASGKSARSRDPCAEKPQRRGP